MRQAWVAMCCVAGCISFAPAATLVVVADRDNTLIERADGSASNGKGARIFAGETLQDGSRRALIRFDVSSIPAGASVTSAVLRLSMDMTRAGPNSVHLHRVTSDWGEGNSSSSGGQGAPAQPDDATWLHRFFPSMLWGAPGGDFQPASSTFTVVDEPGAYTWGSAPGMVGDVQAWVDEPANNFGWLLVGSEVNRSVKRFVSRDATLAAELPDRPTLTVLYTEGASEGEVPLPLWAMVLTGVSLLAGAMRALR